MNEQSNKQNDASGTPAYPVDLRRISTPRENCLMLSLGHVDKGVVIRAEAERFDQLPVIDESGTLRGLIAVEYARNLLDVGQALDESDQALDLCEIGEQPPLLLLLAALSHHRAVIFRDKHRGSEGGLSADWFSLVTISDLNRHPFRADLYPILAELEASLAELIDRRFDDPWSWLPSMSDERQVHVIGSWELEKRNNVDTSPVTTAMLTDMIRVVSKGKEIRDALGFKSYSEFEKISGAIPNLRNRIMHPVRPLILCQDDVIKLHSTLGAILDLTERVRALNARFVAPSMPSAGTSIGATSHQSPPEQQAEDEPR